MNLFESKGLVLDIYEATAAAKSDRINELLGSAPGLLKAPNAVGDTPLHVAALCSQSGVVDATIRYGPDFAERNLKRKNATPSHLGVKSPQKSQSVP